jgi:hypothetical protein
MKYLSKIEDYFLGKLKVEALRDFILELEINPEFKNEFNIYLKALDFTISQEKRLFEDISKLKDFEFDPNVLLDIKKYGKFKQLTEDEDQLLSILQSEKVK